MTQGHVPSAGLAREAFGRLSCSDPAIRPNALTGSPLDRAGTSRADAAWAAAHLADPASLFLPVWRARNLMQAARRRARTAPSSSPATEAVSPLLRGRRHGR